MNNKLTENNETLGVVIKPILTIKDHQKNVTEEIRNESNQPTDSVAMNGTEIDLEVTEGIFNNKKKDNNTKEHKNFGKQEEQKIVNSKIEEEEEALKNAIEDQAREDERPLASNFTLKKILGGDIFSAHLLRNNIGLQKDLIEIDRLQKELSDAKYRSLSSSSQLTERSRESHVLEILKTNKDSVLKISSRPPFIINVPTK